MKYDVLAIGELLIDFACEKTDKAGYPTMSAHPGGAPANFLAALAKFGASTAMITKVGNDAFGRMLKATLTDAGIGTENVIVTDDVFTTLAFVTLDEQGDRTFSFARKPGADTQLCRADVRTGLIDSCSLLHFGTVSMTDEPSRDATKYAVEYARAHGKTVTCDPNLRKPLWHDLDDAREQMLWSLAHADVVKISDEEVEFLFGKIPYEEAAEKILKEYGVRLVFLTMGKDGCLYANCNAMGHIPALSGLNTVDTTGAGDIFGGSAVWKMLQTGKAPEALEKADLDEIVRFACTSAGLSTTKFGGISSVPALEEVCRKMQQKPVTRRTRILSIGNSFTLDSTRYIHEIAEQYGENVETTALYIGGCSLLLHYELLLSDVAAYELYQDGYDTGRKITIRQALEMGGWDYVTLQQASHYSFRYETYQPYLDKLAEAVRKAAPDAKILLHQTWGYRPESDRLHKYGFETHRDMFLAAKAAYEQAAAAISADGTIPTGSVIEQLVASGIQNTHRDEIHLSEGVSRYAAALSWLRYILGLDISEDSFSDFDAEVTDDEAAAAKAIASRIGPM